MRPLPRVLAFSDARIAALPDLGIRAAALAAVGPAVALVARLPGGRTDDLTALAARFRALAAAPEAQVCVSGRSDVAAAVGQCGIILRRADLPAHELREILGDQMILASVHDESEAELAVSEGNDGLVVGTIWPTPTHKGRPGSGPELLARLARFGIPVWAIGGVTQGRAVEAHGAGAWGVAAISALWDADDPYRAALAMSAPWRAA